MKIETILELYPLNSEWMYDFSQGCNDFIRIEIETIENKNSIMCFKFKNKTGFWPVEKKLIKRLDEVGIGNYYKPLKIVI